MAHQLAAPLAFTTTGVGSSRTANGQPSRNPTTLISPLKLFGTLHESAQVKPQP